MLLKQLSKYLLMEKNEWLRDNITSLLFHLRFPCIQMSCFNLKIHFKKILFLKARGSNSQLTRYEFIYNFLNVCPVDYTAFAVNGKVGIP